MKSGVLSLVLLFVTSCNTLTYNDLTPSIVVSDNNRFLETEKGDPFFWLGDTGWLLPSKLTREEAEIYLEDRRKKGFNVIQISVLHNLRNAINVYGDTAVREGRIDRPVVTKGSSFQDPQQYDYWDHIDFLADAAARKGIYLAIVMVWGSNVRSGLVTARQAETYGKWIAERYKDRKNIIWVNGGDIRGDDSTSVWIALGNAVHCTSPGQLITFHPFGRTQSSAWFHNEPWLSFNMFQSGHRRYDQDTTGLAYGEDNWRYAATDYSLLPVKPVIDGEPSYEGIPQGLHDVTQPYWTGSDVRRYAYWSVFAGCFGFTYGNNAVMQFYKPGDKKSAYGAREFWDAGLDAPGASQMQYLKKLILSKPFFERIPANDLLASVQREKYDYIAVTRGEDYVFAYTYTGREITLNLKKMKGSEFKASWFDPRNGTYSESGIVDNNGTVSFDPPGEVMAGNDWVLVLEETSGSL